VKGRDKEGEGIVKGRDKEGKGERWGRACIERFGKKQVGGVIDRGRGCKVIIDIKSTGVAVERSPAGASIITIEKSRICSALIHLTRHKNIAAAAHGWNLGWSRLRSARRQRES
jgi:hypothetical protein